MQINSISNNWGKLQTVNFNGSKDEELSSFTKLAIKDVARACVYQGKVELTPSVIDLFQPEFVNGLGRICKNQMVNYQGCVPKLEIHKNFINVLKPEIKPEVLSEINNELDALQGEIDDSCARSGVGLGAHHYSAEAWFNERNPWSLDVDEEISNGEIETLQPHVEFYKKDLCLGKPCGDDFYGRDLVNVRK